MDDWGRKPKDPPSQYLRLKGKGDSCRVRIAAPPYRELQVWPVGGDREPPLKREVVAEFTPGQWATLLRDPTYDVKEVYHLVVIDRADNTAKIFTTTGGVYGKIRDFAQNPEWGDPKGYDLTITRTEQPGKNYYDVVPSPNKTVLLTNELEAVDKLNVRKLVPTALPAAAPQPDDLDGTVDPEPLPWNTPLPKAPASNEQSPAAADQEPEPEHFDKVFNDFDPNEPVNLDDIPF